MRDLNINTADKTKDTCNCDTFFFTNIINAKAYFKAQK